MILSEEFTERVVSQHNQLSHYREIHLYRGKVPAGMEAFEGSHQSSPIKFTESEITAEDTCGLYFTSGTTGDPKPIVLTHGIWSLLRY